SSSGCGATADVTRAAASSAALEPVSDLDPRGIVRVVALFFAAAPDRHRARIFSEAERVRVERSHHTVRIRILRRRQELVQPAPARPPEPVEADDARAVLAGRDETDRASFGSRGSCNVRLRGGRRIAFSSFHCSDGAIRAFRGPFLLCVYDKRPNGRKV